MKFVLSYSGGNDSVMALHRMVSAGNEPVALLTMYNAEEGRSWIHGIDSELLEAIAKSLRIPLLRCKAATATYGADMESGLRQAAALGAEVCVFGDIDVEEHRRWDEERCAAAGLRAILPLWQCSREENAFEALRLGYRCIVKCIWNDTLPESFLGRPLTSDMLEQMRELGIDLCGENGEYHTVVTDGPLFRRPVELEYRGVVRFGNISAADLAVGGTGGAALAEP